MFRIEMLPAERGDCLWVSYGTSTHPHHLLIDGGPSQTISSLVPALERRIRALPGTTDRVELAVETHIDADHIQGLVSLLSDPARVPLFKDIWMNGYRHVAPVSLGATDAEMLTASLLPHPDRWNAAFEGNAVVVPDDGPLPVVTLAGGMRLTLLTPTRANLNALYKGWQQVMGAMAGKGTSTPADWRRGDALGAFDPLDWADAPFTEDRSLPNRSGISFIAEFGGRRALFLADVPPKGILAAFDRLGQPIQHFDAVKLSHHASRNNTNIALCQRIVAPLWLVSTNGARFKHPHPEALARVVVSQPEPPTFVLNYVTPFVTDLIAGAGPRYQVQLPERRADGQYAEGVTVDL